MDLPLENVDLVALRVELAPALEILVAAPDHRVMIA
jgi:hypothetical protein